MRQGSSPAAALGKHLVRAGFGGSKQKDAWYLKGIRAHDKTKIFPNQPLLCSRACQKFWGAKPWPLDSVAFLLCSVSWAGGSELQSFLRLLKWTVRERHPKQQTEGDPILIDSV